MRRPSPCCCRSLKHEKDQLQQRLDAQQEASVVPQASSAESELQMKGLQEQISQSEELLQVGTASGCIQKPAFMYLEYLQKAVAKAQGELQCYDEGTASVSWCWSRLCL